MIGPKVNISSLLNSILRLTKVRILDVRRLAFMCLLFALVIQTQQQVQAAELAEINLNVFPGGFNWPTYAAQDLGIFKKHGLQVNVQGTKGSIYQMTDLSQGKFDIAMTAIDNIVAYVEGQGEAPIGPQPDFVAILGSDNSFLSLVCTPDIKTFADLKGKTLSVDARTTGYAFVLFDILDRNNLSPSE